MSKADLKEFSQDIFQRIQTYLAPVVKHIEDRIENLEKKELPDNLVTKAHLDQLREELRNSFPVVVSEATKDLVDADFLESQIKQLSVDLEEKIPDAIKGEQGEAGQDGEAGPQGPEGQQGVPGEQGKQGEPGPEGKQGPPGEAGPAGVAGADGESVNPESVRLIITEQVQKYMQDMKLPTPLDLDIINGIDESRSYPRGTYATHKGGLWHAFQQTNGMDGWICIVNGFAGAMDYEYTDPRTARVTLHKAYGDPDYIELKNAGIIYQGVYTEKKLDNYEIGDAVSNNGSLWIATSKPKKAPGMGSPEETGWQLAVKRGRDGKNYEAKD